MPMCRSQVANNVANSRIERMRKLSKTRCLFFRIDQRLQTPPVVFFPRAVKHSHSCMSKRSINRLVRSAKYSMGRCL